MGKVIGYTPYSKTDPDVQAFLTASAITDDTQVSAISYLVGCLKENSLWTKMKAIYPFIGGTASSHKWNLKDPRDLDVAYRLTFNGGLTHSATGCLPDGATGYANTYMPANTFSNNVHLSFYSRTDILTNGNFTDIGASVNNSSYLIMGIYRNSSFTSILNTNYTDGGQLSTVVTSSNIFAIASRLSSTSHKNYKNGVVVGQYTSNVNNISSSTPILLFANNTSGGTAEFSNKQCVFASIGDGLTDTDATKLYNIVQTYQTKLGRQIGTPADFSASRIVKTIDKDALAFINASGITDNTQIDALDDLCTGLKSAGIRSKMKALYPFIGGTASTHKRNLKDPRDLDVAYRLTATGGVTNSANGVQSNGFSGLLRTYLTPSTALLYDSYHVSFYSRTNVSEDAYEIGNRLTASNTELSLSINNTGTSKFTGNNTTSALTGTTPNSLGLFTCSVLNANSKSLYRNTSLLANSTASLTTSLPFEALTLLALTRNSVAQLFSTKQCAFASIGDGLTSTESANLYNIVQAYQTKLGRAV